MPRLLLNMHIHAAQAVCTACMLEATCMWVTETICVPQVAALLLASYRVLSPWLRDDKVILLRENKHSHPSQVLERF